jgi:patatin-like phospholipase/acyl hydrolase
MPNEASPPRFQVLALDGGGVRGIFTAAVLAALEEDIGHPVLDHFDMVVGTSTRGIIALV